MPDTWYPGSYPGQAATRYFIEQQLEREAAQERYQRALHSKVEADLLCRRLDRALAGRSSVETRSAATAARVVKVDRGDRVVTVIAVPYGQKALVPFKGDVWSEIFERGAFDGIESDPEKIRVNREHDRADAVGKVIRFDPRDSRGLVADIRVARSRRGDDTLALAAERALSASVGFGVRPGGQLLDRFTKTRRITRAWLDHIALVQQPAYDGAQVLAVGGRGLTDSDAAVGATA